MRSIENKLVFVVANLQPFTVLLFQLEIFWLDQLFMLSSGYVQIPSTDYARGFNITPKCEGLKIITPKCDLGEAH